jgi:hypothetical protein
MERLKLLDIILLPKRFYEGISGRLWTLYIGVILVGINDLFVTIYANFDKLFSGKSVSIKLLLFPFKVSSPLQSGSV